MTTNPLFAGLGGVEVSVEDRVSIGVGRMIMRDAKDRGEGGSVLRLEASEHLMLKKPVLKLNSPKILTPISFSKKVRDVQSFPLLSLSAYNLKTYTNKLTISL